MVSLQEIFSLLIDAVPNYEVTDLLRKCELFEMTKEEYNSSVVDDQLPSFHAAYSYFFYSNDNIRVNMDILEKDKIILQAGIHINYPRSIPKEKIIEHFNQLVVEADRFYGTGVPKNLHGHEVMNYANMRSVAYISVLDTSDHFALVFRVGNKQFWQ